MALQTELLQILGSRRGTERILSSFPFPRHSVSVRLSGLLCRNLCQRRGTAKAVLMQDFTARHLRLLTPLTALIITGYWRGKNPWCSLSCSKLGFLLSGGKKSIPKCLSAFLCNIFFFLLLDKCIILFLFSF